MKYLIQSTFRSMSIILFLVIFSTISYQSYAGDLNKDLRKAAKKGHLDEVKSYLLTGALIDSRDNKGRTAIMLASEKGNLDVVKFFLDQGADFTLLDKNGESALSKARKNNNRRVVETLEFAQTEADQSINSYRTFLDRYPSSSYAKVATIRLEELEWEEACSNANLYSLISFINEHKKSTHIDTALALIAGQLKKVKIHITVTYPEYDYLYETVIHTMDCIGIDVASEEDNTYDSTLSFTLLGLPFTEKFTYSGNNKEYNLYTGFGIKGQIELSARSGNLTVPIAQSIINDTHESGGWIFQRTLQDEVAGTDSRDSRANDVINRYSTPQASIAQEATQRILEPAFLEVLKNALGPKRVIPLITDSKLSYYAKNTLRPYASDLIPDVIEGIIKEKGQPTESMAFLKKFSELSIKESKLSLLIDSSDPDLKINGLKILDEGLEKLGSRESQDGDIVPQAIIEVLIPQIWSEYQEVRKLARSAIRYIDKATLQLMEMLPELESRERYYAIRSFSDLQMSSEQSNTYVRIINKLNDDLAVVLAIIGDRHAGSFYDMEEKSAETTVKLLIESLDRKDISEIVVWALERCTWVRKGLITEDFGDDINKWNSWLKQVKATKGTSK